MKYSFCYNSLKEVPFQKYDMDFTFIVDGKRYQTPRIVADLLSPKVRKFHFIDSTISEVYLDTADLQSIKRKEEDERDYFSEFLQLINSEDIEIDSTQQKYYATYFYKLGNTSEYIRLQPEYSEPLSLENAIERLQKIDKFTINISDDIDRRIINIDEIISFIASHFYQISKDELKRLSTHFLSAILSSSDLKISDEDSLLEFIISLYEEDHNASCLFSLVLLTNVSENVFEHFINTIEFEDVNFGIWSSICKRLLPNENTDLTNENRYICKNSSDKKQKSDNFKEFKAEIGHEFEGIMHYLTQKTGGNIHNNGTIEITSNSIGCFHPKFVVDYQNNNYYHSNDIKDGCVCFDFKERRIQLSNYAIKSAGNRQNDNNLRNWSIEVSNDGQNWEEVDRHSEDSTLNGEELKSIFNVTKEQTSSYRFIRLHQTGYSWNGYPQENSYFLSIYSIEFFGKLEEEK